MLVALLPRSMARVFREVERVKLPSGVTDSGIVVVAFKAPEAPVMLTVYVPAFAVSAAANVTTLDDAVGFVPKEAVTPFGSPDADSDTGPENPFSGVILIVPLPLPAPCTIVTPAPEDRRRIAGD